MVDINEQFKTMNQRRDFSIFKKGVRDKNLCKSKGKEVFRLMPAFNPDDPDPKTSTLPSILPDGTMSNWGIYFFMSGFMGYDNFKKSIISPKSLNHDAPCPLHDLYDTIIADKARWGYMITRGQDGSYAVFSKPSPRMAVNVIDVNEPTLGVMLGQLTSGAATSLINLVTAKVSNQHMRELAKDNYLYGYANGDLTDINEGIWLSCAKEETQTAKGKMAGYAVKVYLETNHTTGETVTRNFPITQDWLPMRYNLTRMDTYLDIMSYEDIVKELVTIYNRRTPDGNHHEFELLHTAFPEYSGLIPKPPASQTWSPGEGQSVIVHSSPPPQEPHQAPQTYSPPTSSTGIKNIPPPTTEVPKSVEVQNLEKYASNPTPPPSQVMVPGDKVNLPPGMSGANPPPSNNGGTMDALERLSKLSS